MAEIGLDPSDPRLTPDDGAGPRDQRLSAPSVASMSAASSSPKGGWTNWCPIENATMEERTVICWDKDDIDALGILKVDVLSLGMLTCIRKAFDLLTQHHRIEYTLATLPPEDPAVYDMLCAADSVGVFQVESRAQMNFLPRMRPR